MIVFGLILVALAVLLTAGVAASSGNRATLDVFGVGLNTRASVVFFIGLVTAIALLIGLWMTKAGLARGYRRRKEVRELRHQAKTAPAPVADMSSSHSDRADDQETKEVAASNDADKGEEGPRHRATGSKSTPPGASDDTGREPVGKPEDAGRMPMGKADDVARAPAGKPDEAGRAAAGTAEDAETTPGGRSDDIWRTSANRSADAGSAEQTDDGIGTVPRSGTDRSS